MSGEKRSEEPHDRLTRICDAVSDTFYEHPETRPDDKGIIFLESPDRGGLVMMRYDDDTEAIAALLMHLRAIFRANGKDLLIAPLGGEG